MATKPSFEHCPEAMFKVKEQQDKINRLEAEIGEYTDEVQCLSQDHKRLKAEKAELVEALRDCEHIMNISANPLCTPVDSSGQTALNKQLVECVIRTRTALHKFSPRQS